MTEVVTNDVKIAKGPSKGSYEVTAYFNRPWFDQFCIYDAVDKPFTKEQELAIARMLDRAHEEGVTAGREEMRKDLKDLLGIASE